MNRDPSTAVVLLAAGASTRMGTPKQLLAFRGRGLLRRTAEEAVASRCGPVIAVLGAHAPRLLGELADLPVRVVVNDAWETGMSTSVRAGIEALGESEVTAAILTVCDQPFLSDRLFRRLAGTHARTGRPIVAAAYEEILGVPALFHRSLFPELCALAGGEGARRVIEAHAAEAASIPFSLGAIDIDTPEDLARLTAARAARISRSIPIDPNELRTMDTPHPPTTLPGPR
jgi:molybdenum cofactor cytidylyltransferase